MILLTLSFHTHTHAHIHAFTHTHTHTHTFTHTHTHTQGTMMGVLTAAGSLARFLGPIFVSNLYHSQGPLITFAAVDGIIGVSIVVLLVFSWRLVPYKYS